MLKDNSPETAEALRAFNENTLTEANRVREALLVRKTIKFIKLTYFNIVFN